MQLIAGLRHQGLYALEENCPVVVSARSPFALRL
jgi:hypothetical protein